MVTLNFYIDKRKILISETPKDLPKAKLVDLIFFALDNSNLFKFIDFIPFRCYNYCRKYINKERNRNVIKIQAS